MSASLIADIFQICILPLLGVLTAFVVQLIKTKTSELSAKTDNELADKYLKMISATVQNCVIATNQTYVDVLKQQGKFDEEAQKIAFNKTYEAILNILDQETKKYIAETAGDLTIYLTQAIEAQVNKIKNQSIITK